MSGTETAYVLGRGLRHAGIGTRRLRYATPSVSIHRRCGCSIPGTEMGAVRYQRLCGCGFSKDGSSTSRTFHTVYNVQRASSLSAVYQASLSTVLYLAPGTVVYAV
eukprot:3941981-Rhodomonas_salina.5